MAFENSVGEGENAVKQYFLLFPQCFKFFHGLYSISWATFSLYFAIFFSSERSKIVVWERVNPLPHMPIFGFSNLAENKDMTSEIWTNEDIVIRLSRKHCVKRRNCSFRAISSFPTMFSKADCCWCVKMSIYEVKGWIRADWLF